MLPDDRLSTFPVPGTIIGGRAQTANDRVDFENGGVNLSDPSLGLNVKVWKGEIIDDKIFLSAEDVVPVEVYSGNGLTSISIAFDQNMNYFLAFTEQGVAKIRWYDTTILVHIVTVFTTGYRGLKATMDDKRMRQSSNNDIILSYIRNNGLYYRQQRDRFTIERLLKGELSDYSRLLKIGMGNNWRLQFVMSKPKYGG